MKKTAFLGCCLLVITALAAPGFSQQIDDPKEWDAYVKGVYEEKDLPKKAANGDKFLVDYPKSTARTQAYTLTLLAYANTGNWAKALEKSDQLTQVVPAADNALKLQAYTVGMVAAQQLQNVPKTKDYAEKILTLEPKNFKALYTLSSILVATIPGAAGAAKDTHLANTLTITNRALAEPKPADIAADQWPSIQVGLTHTTCMVLYNQQKYPDSITACQKALALNKAFGDSYYLLGLSQRIVEMAPATKKYEDAVKEYNDQTKSGNQILIAELKAVYENAEKIADEKLDLVLDTFAKGAAAGGNFAKQNREEAEKLYKIKHDGSSDGFDALIAQKKAEIGAK